MSMVPLRFRDWWNDWDFDRPSRLLDQNFGLGLRRDDLLSSLTSSLPTSSLIRNNYYRPWNHALSRQQSASTINMTKDKFEVILDVQQFAPEEITVKTTDNTIVVEAKHEEKQDEHGFISRQFTRKYILPQGFDANDVTSALSSDGVLTITAPKKLPPPPQGERVVPVQKTGPSKQSEQPSSQPTTTTIPTTHETSQPTVTSP